MNILVTGAGGFVGRNLVQNLKTIRDRKEQTHQNLNIEEIYEYDKNIDKDEDLTLLKVYCKNADFVFHLAGVNRPKEVSEFEEGNLGALNTLLKFLRQYNNNAPIMFASSIQAALIGRYKESQYGKSKLDGENLLFQYSCETGVRVFIYRFPNLFGKWCRPNYNSVVATFCNAVANDLEYTVNDYLTELDLVYIDDLVEEMLDILEGKEHRCEYEGLKIMEQEKGNYCYVPTVYHVTLGEIVRLLNSFKSMSTTHYLIEMPEGSFVKRLYSTYLSYLPESKMSYGFNSNIDGRGSFTELLRTCFCGQISVNVAKPGVTKGQHWHNSKWELFIVVSGHGLIQERKIGIDPDTGYPYPTYRFEVSGDEMTAVIMLPGYTHSITNLSKTENLVTVMWANEAFNPKHSDTFYEEVE